MTADFFAGVRRMRTQPKRRTIREGALPLLLSFLSLEISPPYLHPAPAALPTACGVLAYFGSGGRLRVSVSSFVTLIQRFALRCLFLLNGKKQLCI